MSPAAPPAGAERRSGGFRRCRFPDFFRARIHTGRRLRSDGAADRRLGNQDHHVHRHGVIERSARDEAGLVYGVEQRHLGHRLQRDRTAIGRNGVSSPESSSVSDRLPSRPITVRNA